MANFNHIRGSVFVGPTHVMALGHPYVSPVYPKLIGPPLGIDERSREVFHFDPWVYKDKGLINSTFGMVIADKGFGKSSLLKILFIMLMMFTAGKDQMRVLINDYKPEGQGSEYGLITKLFNCVSFVISGMRVNPLEARLFQKNNDSEVYELGVVHVTELILEFLHGAQLLGNYATALRVSIAEMVSNYHPKMWDLFLFEKIARSITEREIVNYFAGLDDKLRHQMIERRDRLVNNGELQHDSEDKIAHLSGLKTNFNVADIQQAGFYLSSLLGRMLHGEYGHMFGSDHSLYEMLTQRMVTQDWRGVGPEAEKLMRTILTTIKTSAIENNNLDLLPHIELDDEKHKAMDNLVYARSHSFFSEIARGTHTCNLSATHRLDSMRKGGEGTELYNLAETIINNNGFVFIGRQTGDESVLAELQRRYGLSNSDTNRLPKLPDYTFLFKPGPEVKARFVRIVAPPPVLEILRTDSSVERMLDRVGMVDKERIEEFAVRSGLKLRNANGLVL